MVASTFMREYYLLLMKALGTYDIVNFPVDLEACPACAGGLFAVVRTYFADTGEPVESGIHVGCLNCDAEIGVPILTAVRLWVSSNYRVKV